MTEHDSPTESEKHVVLSANGISTRYKSIDALTSVSLSVREGESIAIIGRSGSGKSTLLRCLNALQPITNGMIEFKGKLAVTAAGVAMEPQLLRRQVGLVHQEFNLWPNKTVLANLVEAQIVVAGVHRRTACERAIALVEKLGLEEPVVCKYPGELSGGQQQRVAVARALLMEPDVLMLDEVTSALDVETTASLLDLFESLRDGRRSFIFVSHHLSFVRRATSRIFFLDSGCVIEAGQSSELLDNPTSDELKSFLSTVRQNV